MRKFLERDSFESHQLPTLLKAGAVSRSALKGGFGLQTPNLHHALCFLCELVGLGSSEEAGGGGSAGLSEVLKVRTSFILNKKTFQRPKEGRQGGGLL